jgi:hypothetical protein
MNIIILRISIMGEEEYETLRKVAYVFLHLSVERERIEDLSNSPKIEYLQKHGV